MKVLHTLTLIGAMLLAPAAMAAPTVGAPAPDFSATDIAGKPVSLSALKGKIVVLEWTNPGCPFVKKFYEPGAMQRFQKEATAQGVVWISINSSAEGKQGHLSTESAAALVKEQGFASSHLVLDPAGEIGKRYEAKTTPHMFVINAEGTLVYMGAIDDKPSASSDDIATATNYVSKAIAELKASKPVEVSSTKPYGCGVKY